MHLSVRLPQLDPNASPLPTRCPWKHLQTHRRCRGTQFKLHQVHCPKPVRDLRHRQVTVRRYKCLKCHHTFRVYPQGVSAHQLPASLIDLRVLLYLLGLSYQGVVDPLEALSNLVTKTRVYNQPRVVCKNVRQLRRAWRTQQAGQIKVLGLDCTRVKLNGQDHIVAVASAILSDEAVEIKLLESGGSVRVLQRIREIVEDIGAETIVADVADALKLIVDALGCQQQICRGYVNRNVRDRVAQLGTKALDHPDRVSCELPGVTVKQFLADLQDVEWSIKSMPHDGQPQLDQLAQR